MITGPVQGPVLIDKTPVKPGNVFKLLYRDLQEKTHDIKHLKYMAILNHNAGSH